MTKHNGAKCLFLFLLISGMFISGCDDKNNKPAGNEPPSVVVHIVNAAPFSVTTELPGRTSAFRIAEVRPQVSGIILKRNFEEGSDITAGSSLYQIDPATYQAAFESAQGNLAKAQATAQIAHLTVKRYQSLVGTQYVSKQEYDQAVASARQADADVLSAKAAVESARINLAYTKVTSPINGRIGKSNVTEGALVTDGQATALATVQQLDPIYVDLTQSSNDFLQLKQAIEQGSLTKDGTSGVNIIMDNGQTYGHTGKLEFTDVTVDESTGSVTLRAVFPNPDHQLLPGMFVRARVDEGIQPDAILVPQQGVTRTPRGDALVMVVDEQNKVETRPVVASEAIGDRWLVKEGLKPGDKVIVSGIQHIKAGATVKPVTDETAEKTQQGTREHG
ncbi:efflux RND transporter periplasmic adaptor subunit [Atlantibacter hermannii]|uniref:efflux RND transporter periplasmic adaptor subunit n=1 Tax=Atlantibacter hermannii TaxID=565 RepID=UPI0022B791C7|nr:efflux RND transporter periplasmic adaptor subunit [Atlantibacter hermannii]MCZ7836019.1 efflux RND transporter periplasmic adaptor subunit [Atlantibacter hermannii]